PARHDGPRHREAGRGGTGTPVARDHGGRGVPGRGEDARGCDALWIRTVRDAPPGASDPDGDRAGEEHDRRDEHDRRGRSHGRGGQPHVRPRSERRGEERVRSQATMGVRAVLLFVLLSIFLATATPVARAQGPRILLAEVDGAIDRSTVDYVREAIDDARAGAYQALMI